MIPSSTVKKLGFGLVTLLLLLVAGVSLWQAWQHRSSTSSTSATAPNLPQEASLQWQETTPLASYPPILQPLEAEWRKRVKQAESQNTLAQGVGFTLSSQGHKNWTFNVKRVAFEDPSQLNIAYLKGVEGQLVNEANTPVAHFTAPYGVYDQQNKKLQLLGRVTFVHF